MPATLFLFITHPASQMAYIATLNQCQSENLTSNPIVETWSIDAPLDIDDNDTNDTISDASKRSAYGPSAGDGPNNLRTRVVPDANSFFKLQSQSPGHLQWLSVLSEYALLNGDYLGFSDFLYNDPVNTSARPLVYVIDSGFANTHEVFVHSPLPLPFSVFSCFWLTVWHRRWHPPL